MLDEMDRSLHDALCVVKRTLESNTVRKTAYHAMMYQLSANLGVLLGEAHWYYFGVTGPTRCNAQWTVHCTHWYYPVYCWTMHFEW